MDKESRLLQILRKEMKNEGQDYLPLEYLQITTLEIPNFMHEQTLHFMTDENLCKHHRNMIILEKFETAKSAATEIKNRGYEIEILHKSIKYKSIHEK